MIRTTLIVAVLAALATSASAVELTRPAGMPDDVWAALQKAPVLTCAKNGQEVASRKRCYFLLQYGERTFAVELGTPGNVTGSVPVASAK